MSKIARLDEYKSTYSRIKEDLNDHVPGFSERLNYAIDKSSTGLPAVHDGRIRGLAKITGASVPSASGWLTKDGVPRDIELRALSVFIAKHLPHKPNPIRLAAWLRYGDEGDPSVMAPLREANQEYQPLAFQLMYLVCEEAGLATEEIDLNRALKAIANYLACNGLATINQIDSKHKSYIHSLIEEYKIQ